MQILATSTADHLGHGGEILSAQCVVRSEERGIDLENSYAYSDSHHDIPLLEAVGNPRVINPDTLLQLYAQKKHWPIYDFRRMRALKKVAAPVLGRIVKLGALLAPRSWRRAQ